MNTQADRSIDRVDASVSWQPRYVDIVGIAFVVCLLVSNIAAVKLFSLGPLVFTGGILVFPLSYIFGDVLTEVYGYARTRRIIWLGLFANLFMVFVLWVATILPPAPGWPLQEQFAAVHSVVPRIVVASVVAYWAGEIANSIVMSRMKIWLEGKQLWLRAIGSTVVGQLVDSVLFVLIGFAGQMPNSIIITAILTAWVFKTGYEVVILPLTYIIVQRLKAAEGVDHFDRGEHYNPFRV